MANQEVSTDSSWTAGRRRLLGGRSFVPVEAEVRNMLVTEYSVDTAVRVAREEGIEIGEARGEKKVLELLEQGCSVDQIKQRLGPL